MREESMRRVRVISAVLFAIAFTVVVLAAASAHAQPKMPDPFQFPKGKDSPGTVSFDHAKHKDAGVDKCTACHVKLFKMKKGQTGMATMEKMKAGEQCGACHDGKSRVGTKTVFAVADKDRCATCHKK
jgi:c(7)-type cytochrome triheme protein